MLRRFIRSDIRKSRLISLTTLLFVAAAALLVSLAAVLTVNLTGAIDTLMTQAKSPHFMQMHSGAIDILRLEAFAAENSNVDGFQTLEFLNIDGAQLVINGSSLANSVQDNGLCTQSNQFDYLLDLDGNVIHASDGELYVPVCYWKDGTARAGDTAVICGKTFTVTGFLRDSQMNSLLASSKRFLVSENDYAALRASGSVEYLIEFRLKDLSGLAAFEAAYAAAGLEANGPSVTYPLFKTLNAISDGILIAVILLISTLVVTIAFLCIRFTLLAKIEDDYREIGVLKAVGLRVSDIRTIYLAKYAVIAAGGSALGFALSFAFRGILLENIRLYMGESDHASLAFLSGGMGTAIVFLAIIAYVSGVLRRFRRISPAKAIAFGVSQENIGKSRRLRLSTCGMPDTNIFLGIRDVLTRKKLYITMLAVLVFSVFIMVVPLNLYNTISSDSFSSYMGIGSCDMRLDIQQTDEISQKAADIAETMAGDTAISEYVVLTTKAFTAQMDNGTEERVRVELGDHSVFPVAYSQGRAPAAEDEIALSVMNAKALDKTVGDTLTLSVGGAERAFSVCGIYSDITNGGKTAKAVFTDDSADTMWCVICAELSDDALLDETASQYAASFDYAKVSGVGDYITQTFGTTISAIKLASGVALGVALVITVLVTLLFMKMLVAKDRYAIAVMKAFGFTGRDIMKQFAARAVSVLTAGIVLGILLANTLGQTLAGALISYLGAASFRFEVNLPGTYLLCPLAMACAVIMSAMIGVRDAANIKITENMKE